MDAALAARLADAGAIRFGAFTLKSGKQSPIYLDLRVLVSHPPLLQEIATALAGKIRDIPFDRIAAIPYAAIPIGTALSLASGKPMIYTRKEAKAHGTQKIIEGEFHPHEIALVLDDLITTGLSKHEAISPLTQAGLRVHDIIVIIDREQGGTAAMEKQGMHLHCLFTISELLEALHQLQRITSAQKKEVEAYLASASE